MTKLLCPAIEVASSIAVSKDPPYYLGDSITYTCLDGATVYDVLNAEQTINCVAGPDGPVWDSDVIECKRKRLRNLQFEEI